MEGIKSTSCIYENINELKFPESAYACFCEEDENSCHLELYPRPNGDMYVCGCGGSEHVSGARLLPEGDCGHADSILADPARVDAAHQSFAELSIIGETREAPDIAQVLPLCVYIYACVYNLRETGFYLIPFDCQDFSVTHCISVSVSVCTYVLPCCCCRLA
jgi:hypothetical protein